MAAGNNDPKVLREIRDLRREMRDLRRETRDHQREIRGILERSDRRAAEDRKQAAKDRLRSDRTHASLVLVLQSQVRATDGILKGQQIQTRLLQQILHTLKIAGNSHPPRGNSKPRR